MPRTATIGPAVYKRVNELVGEGKNRTEAFATVAQERNMNAGTVAANFYRTARTQGTSKPRRARAKTTRPTATTTRKPQTRRAPARTSTSRAAAPNGDLSALAAQIGVLVQQLVRQVEERDRRLREVLG
jgi:septal ring-binding cell division protein DamX